VPGDPEGPAAQGMKCIYQWFYEKDGTLRKIHAAFDRFKEPARGGDRRDGREGMQCLMGTTPVSAYRLEFAKRTEWRREEERRSLERSRQKEEKDQRDREAGHDVLLDTVVIATKTEIASFNMKLDAYDTATVEALMENKEAHAEVREKVRIMLDKAYVLPDGHKVFKTEDGTRVTAQRGPIGGVIKFKTYEKLEIFIHYSAIIRLCAGVWRARLFCALGASPFLPE
jgi:hypothetical protein